MRRAALAAVIVAVTSSTTACSLLSAPEETTGRTAVADDAQRGPVPTSQQFDRAFPVAGESWDATVTMSNLRIIPSSTYTDSVVAVDVRAVQAAGEPTIDPVDFRAYDPSGEEFERIENTGGTVDDPLIQTVMGSPGQEVRGTVAWTMRRGARIGRIDLTTPRTIASLTITRQPVDPAASTG